MTSDQAPSGDRLILVGGSTQRQALVVEPDIHETDIYRWSREQAEHIRAGRFDLVDRINAADEIEDVGKREEEALISDLERILAHMLKWDHQPEKRSRSWALSIAEHRDRVEYRLEKAPTLRARHDELLVWGYKFARRRASRETKLPLETFPETCAYSWAEVMGRPFEYSASNQ